MHNYQLKECLCGRCGLVHLDVVDINNPPPHLYEGRGGRWVERAPNMSRGKRKAYKQMCDQCLFRLDPNFALKYAEFKRKVLLYPVTHKRTVR